MLLDNDFAMYFPYLVLSIAVVAMFFQYWCGQDFTIDDDFTYVDSIPQAVNLTRLTPDKTLQYTRYSLYLPSESALLHAWLYLPHHRVESEDEAPVTTNNSITPTALPLIIMSHGLGAQKDFGLETYAISFIQAGYSVLIFDYRHFGGSFPHKTTTTASSLPLKRIRNLIQPWHHVEDMVTVIHAVEAGMLQKYTTPMAKVDSTHIVLWGTSFAGGHVLMSSAQLATTSPAIRAVISQVPHLNGKEASKRAIQQRGLAGTLKIAFISVVDYLVSHVLGYSPLYIKIAGTTNDTAYMMLSKEELELYYSKHPVVYLGGWKNLAPARTVAMMSFYNPIEVVPKIKVPILFIGATDDALCPIDFLYQAKQSSPQPELIEVMAYDSTHFKIYQLPEVKEKMIAFLQQHLPATADNKNKSCVAGSSEDSHHF